MPKSIIYYHTSPITSDLKQTSGSYVHLANLLKGFQESGYEVEVVAGFARERIKKIKRLKEEIRQGRRFDFVFIWSSTGPSLLPLGNLFHPFLDFSFFRWCQRQSIPVGVFYGDVFWKFDLYRQILPWTKWAILIPLFYFDWVIYRRSVDQLFIPTLRMKDSLPTEWPEDRVSALFPGCTLHFSSDRSAEEEHDRLELFYVGNVEPPLYDIKQMLEGVLACDGAHLTICCPEVVWHKYRSYYLPNNDPKISIVHASGQDLEYYYQRADLFGLFRSQHPYLTFAMPVKIFEAIGHGLPILTTAGTEAANFITQEKIGWAVTNKDELIALLECLKDHPEEIHAKRERLGQLREHHTWKARAAHIARIFSERTFKNARN